MASTREEKIKDYTSDWHWDKASEKFAFELGQYLFDFMDDLRKNSGLKESTIRKHSSNCWCIGILICQYGYHDEFSPEIFAYPPHHEIEFRRKMSDSKYEVQSYKATCKKLEKYALKKGDFSYDEI